MKKIICIIGMILCLALGGTAFAAVTYYGATTLTGTISADKAIVLSLGEDATRNLNLVEGSTTSYTIACNVDKSTTAEPNVTLKVEIATYGEKAMDKINVAVYTNSTCSEAYLVGETPLVLQGSDAQKYFEITGIEDNDVFYLGITLDSISDEVEFANIGAQLNISLTHAD